MKFRFNPLFIGAVTLLLLGAALPVTRAYCGDGALETDHGEVCDDGNVIDRDGCSSYCQLEDITPPEIRTVSVAENATNVPATIRTFTVTFSEPIDSATLLPANFSIRNQDRPLTLTLMLGPDQKTVTMHLEENLVPESGHALRIKAVRDLSGNLMVSEFIRVFSTSVRVDRTPPFLVSDPPAGTYGFPQNVSFIAYPDQNHVGLGLEEEGVKIYYTTDGSQPDTKSPLFTNPFDVKTHTALHFFGIDGSGNRSGGFTQIYDFGCNDHPNAKRLSPFPLCRILECDKGFDLKNNACVAKLRLGGEGSDYRDTAFTAPFFSSDAPLSVTSSALHVTAEHKGLLKRPIIFRNAKRDSEVHFAKDTLISTDDGKAFAGYLLAPIGRFIKDYPINFGYSFKTILEFSSPDGVALHFDKPYQVVVALGETFDPEKEISVFTLTLGTSQYQKLPADNVTVDWFQNQVSFSSNKTDVFFVAQPGENFNRAEFGDMENHWAKNYAEALYRRGIVKGKSKGVYAPEDPLTRAEFTKIALASIGVAVDPQESVEDAPFPDVPLYAWYVGTVKKAKELGLIAGYADGTFHPEQPIKRVEAIKILISAFKFDLTSNASFKGEGAFPDVEPGSWYYPTVNFAIEHQLLDGLRSARGVVTGNFGPDHNINRGEMAELATKTIELKEAERK